MKIYNCSDYEFSSIELNKPVKELDFYCSDIEIFLQTPKITINKINNDYAILNINDSFENFLVNFDNYIMEQLSKNSEKLFKEYYSLDDIEEIYKSSIRIKKNKNITFKALYSNKLNIFNRHKEQLKVSDLNNSDNVICLIKCSKIIYYKTFCMPYWEILQIKVKEEKLKQGVYLFKEDINDSYIEKEENEQSLKLKLLNLDN